VIDYTVSWFSAGVSSAVATKLDIDNIDKIIYVHIDDQHEDSIRFVKDCEQWFGKEIEIMQSWHKNVENVLRFKNAIKFPKGAPCTNVLKKQVRKDWEREHPEYNLTYVWGMDVHEAKPRPPKGLSRVDAIREANPDQQHRFPLVDLMIDKEGAHEIMAASGIRRPAMYDLGYHNNNCIGCVKGGMGYWNKIRQDFPEVFKKRAELERLIGHSILTEKVKGQNKKQPVFLDELDPDRGRHEGPIVGDCGIMCEIYSKL